MAKFLSISDPITFFPIYKEKVWGGRRLETVLCKSIPEARSIGESWELSGYSPDCSKTATQNEGIISIQDLLTEYPAELCGSRTGGDMVFPLLFKFIDAQLNLSVQVHPSDEQVRTYRWGAHGKEECWYIIDTHPGARVIAGLKRGVTPGDLEAAINGNTVEELLQYVPIQKGDVLLIPPGMVHAVLEGTLLYEVEQSSDITFRLFDWNRSRQAGARPLHGKESVAACNCSYHESPLIPPIVYRESDGISHSFRVVCSYFALEEYRFSSEGRISLLEKSSFAVLTVIAGAVALVKNTPGERYRFRIGDTVLLPHASLSHGITMEGEGGTCCLLTSVPDLIHEIIQPLKTAGIDTQSIAALGGLPQGNDLLRALHR